MKLMTLTTLTKLTTIDGELGVVDDGRDRKS